MNIWVKPTLDQVESIILVVNVQFKVLENRRGQLVAYMEMQYFVNAYLSFTKQLRFITLGDVWLWPKDSLLQIQRCQQTQKSNTQGSVPEPDNMRCGGDNVTR